MKAYSQTLNRQVHTLLCIVLVLPLSPRAWADATASSGTPAAPNTEATITVNTDDPNPYTTGIGSTSTANSLIVNIDSGAGLNVAVTPAITLHSTSTVTNHGSIAGTQTGILGVNSNTINNQGVIQVIGTGIQMQGNNLISNPGAITAGAAGLSLQSSNTVNGSGTITAGTGNGLSVVNNNAIIFTGNITSTGSRALAVGDDNQAAITGNLRGGTYGVVAGARNVIAVTGDITGGSQEAVIMGDNNQLTTQGTVTSNSANGITAGANNTITLNGAVTAGQVGVLATNGNTLTNQGTITSGSGSSGVQFAANNTLTNQGIITGGNGTAISFASGTNSLTLDTGSVLNGNVVGGTGSDQLLLQGSGSEDAVFQNFEALTVNGIDWTLSGNSSFPTTTIQQGRLGVDGILVGDIDINSNGTLGGSGAIIGSVANVGTVNPGNSVGTLTINGSYAQTGTLEIDIQGGRGDVLAVSGTPGTATLAGNLRVHADGPDVSYSFVTATGEVSGTFTSVAPTTNRVQQMVTYTANAVNVTTLSPAGLDARTDAALNTATLFLDTLSGRLHGRQGLGSNQPYAMAALLGGPYPSADLEPSAFWLQGVGKGGERKASDGVSGSEYSLGGLALGGDHRISDDLTLGGGFAAVRGDMDIDENAGTTSIDSYLLGAYLGYESPTSDSTKLFLDVAFGGGMNKYDSQRHVYNNGSSTTAQGNFNGTTLGARLATGAIIEQDRTIWRPMALLDYVWAHQDGYTEGNADNLNTQYEDQGAQALKLAGILALSHSYHVGDTTLTPEIRGGVVQEWALDNRTVGAQISGLGGSFTLQGNNQDETRGLLGLGGSWWFHDELSAFLDAHSEFGSRTKSYTLQGGLRFLF